MHVFAYSGLLRINNLLSANGKTFPGNFGIWQCPSSYSMLLDFLKAKEE